MKTLLLMRHAKSSWSSAGLADIDRPLNRRGVSAASKMGRLIAEQDLIPDVIVSSSSKRTKETVKYFLEECPFNGDVQFTRDLYHGGPDSIIESVRRWGDGYDCIMVVGHNPGMEYAVEEFTGEEERMVTAAIAQITFTIDAWDQLEEGMLGDLVNFWRPREIE